MTLTPEQFNKIATKEDLKDLANKIETKEMFNRIILKINIIMHKLDKIEHITLNS